jgi:enamine deaminase RidA (YjgF/YER057c/UK114 family)
MNKKISLSAVLGIALLSACASIEAKPPKLTLGDVVMMRVYLGADPAKGGKMDFEGMMAGYSQFFGTKEQPNKPARTTVQVVLPAGDRGALVEVDVIAMRPK